MTPNNEDQTVEPLPRASRPQAEAVKTVKEVGGGKGPEPTRYGDWELRGRCIDF